MRQTVKLEKLRSSLPIETRDALQSGGFFNASEDVIVRRKAVASDVDSLEEGERAAIMYISTRGVDRDKEVLVPSGAVLKEFKAAPQVLWNHDYGSPPIAKAEWVQADEHGIKAKTVFADTPRAEEIWSLVKGGFLKTTSVGFIPLEWTQAGQDGWEKTVSKYNDLWHADLEAAGCSLITSKWMVLEYSLVSVPANIEATVTAVAKGLLKISDDLRTELGIPDPDGTTDKGDDQNPPAPRRILLPQEPTKRIVQIVSCPTQRRVIDITKEALDQLRGRV